MKFSDFEEIMHSNGVNTLADIARVLDTTPQAVSNWKSRDQVPYHIENKINFMLSLVVQVQMKNDKNFHLCTCCYY